MRKGGCVQLKFPHFNKKEIRNPELLRFTRESFENRVGTKQSAGRTREQFVLQRIVLETKRMFDGIESEFDTYTEEVRKLLYWDTVAHGIWVTRYYLLLTSSGTKEIVALIDEATENAFSAFAKANVSSNELLVNRCSLYNSNLTRTQDKKQKIRIKVMPGLSVDVLVFCLMNDVLLGYYSPIVGETCIPYIPDADMNKILILAQQATELCYSNSNIVVR